MINKDPLSCYKMRSPEYRYTMVLAVGMVELGTGRACWTSLLVWLLLQLLSILGDRSLSACAPPI